MKKRTTKAKDKKISLCITKYGELLNDCQTSIKTSNKYFNGYKVARYENIRTFLIQRLANKLINL